MLSHFVRKLAPAPGSAKLARLAGRAWHVLPDGWKLFGPGGPDLDAWIAAGLAETVKAGGPRTVYRVKLPGGVVYAKRTQSKTPRQWAREFLRPAKARLEFENALELLRRGLPAAEPLAWGAKSRWLPGESIILTLGRPKAVSLDEYIVRHPDQRRIIAVELGRLFAAMHNAGVAHPDPHPGNILVEATDDGPQFTLLDVHAVVFGPVTWNGFFHNLALLNRWFQLRATRTDRLRFWRAYIAALDEGQKPTGNCPTTYTKWMPRHIESLTAASNARFWTDRLSRYTSSNRQFQKVGKAGFAVKEMPAAFLKALAADPDAPFRDPANRVLKDSRSSTVIELTVPTTTGPVAAVYKRVNVKGAWRIKNLLRPTQALRSWVLGHSLRDRGLPTPRPLCVLHRHRGGIMAEGYLLVEKVPDAVGLEVAAGQTATARQATTSPLSPASGERVRVRGNDFPTANAAPPPVSPKRGRLSEAVGRLIRDLHDKQVCHRDLKAPNVLVSRGEPVLIDLVGVAAGKPIPRAIRIRDLARLNASFWQNAAVSRTDRLRVLFAYLNVGLHGETGWKDWWRAIQAATAAKAARNARAGRVLG